MDIKYAFCLTEEEKEVMISALEGLYVLASVGGGNKKLMDSSSELLKRLKNVRLEDNNGR